MTPLRFCELAAAGGWHCQGLLARGRPSPPSSGTARDFWLPDAFFWHCQGFLAPGAFSPLRIGTARVSWHGAGFRHSALALPGFFGSLARFSGTARDSRPPSAPDAAPYASARGSVTVIVVPSPGVLSQLIVPPSSSQMRLTMDSPSPLPPSTCERFAW
jgi:hypothetical protein